MILILVLCGSLLDVSDRIPFRAVKLASTKVRARTRSPAPAPLLNACHELIVVPSADLEKFREESQVLAISSRRA